MTEKNVRIIFMMYLCGYLTRNKIILNHIIQCFYKPIYLSFSLTGTSVIMYTLCTTRVGKYIELSFPKTKR